MGMSSYDRMITLPYNCTIIRSYDRMIVLSYVHMIMLRSCNDMIKRPHDFMIT